MLRSRAACCPARLNERHVSGQSNKFARTLQDRLRQIFGTHSPVLENAVQVTNITTQTAHFLAHGSQPRDRNFRQILFEVRKISPAVTTQNFLTSDAFQRRELDILVSTPVVEVGIDIPNTTVMLIDGADRFGIPADAGRYDGDIAVGEAVVEADGRVLFNGRPLQSETAFELGRRCRALLRAAP